MKDLYNDENSLSPYRCLDFSPDGKFLATGEADGNIRVRFPIPLCATAWYFLIQIWITSQKRVRNTFRHRHIVTALNFSPNGQCLVTCSLDRNVRIWKLRDGSSRELTTFEDHPWSVRCSLDGQHIASGCNPGHILIWNMRTGKPLKKWQSPVLIVSLVFTPDGKGLLGGSWEQEVTHWDVTSLRSLGNSDPLTSDMVEISRFLGHKVRWSHSQFIHPPHSTLRHGNQHSLGWR